MKEDVAVDCAKQSVSSNSNEMRILDRCRHFLGKMWEGNVYIYCGKCKKFVLVHKH